MEDAAGHFCQFHEDVPLAFIQQVFDIMNRANWHQYQILTKRSARLLELSPLLPWADHIWMGVSVETAKYIHRIDDLRGTDAHIKFLSLEPLLGRIPSLNLERIDWVIVGGESGPGARPMAEDWVSDLQAQCRNQEISFFYKQWGGVNKRRAGRLLKGRTWDEMPLAFAGTGM
jgi:protein gp37